MKRTFRFACTLLIWLNLSGEILAQEFNPICNDCWCIVPGDGAVTSADTCPAYETDLITPDSIDSSWAPLLASFELIDDGEPLQLVDPGSGSSECYPFRSTVGAFPTTSVSTTPNENYKESNFTQCDVSPTQPMADIPVCVFEFVSTDETEPCSGRQYRLKTMNESMVDEDTMMVIHTGACGVCSTAQDVGARVTAIVGFRGAVTLASTAYFISQDIEGRFETLVTSLRDNLNLTPECARLWGHFGATNGAACNNVCLPDASGQIPTFQPGTCDTSACVDCSKDFTAQFQDLGGIGVHAANAGFAADFPITCPEFYVPDVQLCLGASTDSVTETAAPTSAPESSADNVSVVVGCWLVACSVIAAALW